MTILKQEPMDDAEETQGPRSVAGSAHPPPAPMTKDEDFKDLYIKQLEERIALNEEKERLRLALMEKERQLIELELRQRSTTPLSSMPLGFGAYTASQNRAGPLNWNHHSMGTVGMSPMLNNSMQTSQLLHSRFSPAMTQRPSNLQGSTPSQTPLASPMIYRSGSGLSSTANLYTPSPYLSHRFPTTSIYQQQPHIPSQLQAPEASLSTPLSSRSQQLTEVSLNLGFMKQEDSITGSCAHSPSPQRQTSKYSSDTSSDSESENENKTNNPPIHLKGWFF
jgi:hypothetical protein